MEKIREVINKRIQEKKKNEFTDLAPIDDIENGAEYLKALHWAIKKKKVKNIPLITSNRFVPLGVYKNQIRNQNVEYIIGYLEKILEKKRTSCTEIHQ